MIQRIQSLYLFLVGLLIFLMFFLPLAGVVLINSQEAVFNCSGVHLVIKSPEGLLYKISHPGYLIAFNSFLSILAIFMFKNHKRQKKLIILNIISVVILEGLLWYDKFHLSGTLTAHINIRYPYIFPVIAIVLLILAYRAVIKDEELIRSADRLR